MVMATQRTPGAIGSGVKVKRLHCRAFEEAMTVASVPVRVDREAGIIYGVKVLGLQSCVPARMIGMDSDEPYAYEMSAAREAIPIYECRDVNVDHPDLEIKADGRRLPVPGWKLKADNKFGVLRNVRAVEGVGLFADLHYLRDHPMASRVCEAAERMPTLFRLSHVAEIVPEFRSGRVVITKILEVESVDLIGAKGGTNNSLFESGVAEMDMSNPNADAAAAESEAVSVDAAFRKLIQAVVDDDGIPSAKAINLIEALQEKVEALRGSGKDEEAEKASEAPGAGEATGTTESAAGNAKPSGGVSTAATESAAEQVIGGLKSVRDSITAIESAGVKLSASRIQAFESATSPATKTELIAGWKAADAAAAQPVKGKESETPASRPALESAASGGASGEVGKPREATLDMLR